MKAKEITTDYFQKPVFDYVAMTYGQLKEVIADILLPKA